MTTSWLVLVLSCMAAAIVGFSAVRLGRAGFDRPEPVGDAPPRQALAATSPPAPSRRLPVAPPPAYTAPAPKPTAPMPDGRLLELWAVQVDDGARKMSIATDGCRVTWNRRCKHGHPAWIVYLDYVWVDDA